MIQRKGKSALQAFLAAEQREFRRKKAGRGPEFFLRRASVRAFFVKKEVELAERPGFVLSFVSDKKED